MANFTTFNEKNNIEVKTDSDDSSMEDESYDLKQTESEMFEYYQRHNNLNDYYYAYDSPRWRNKIEEYSYKFFKILNENKEKKTFQSEDTNKNVDSTNFQTVLKNKIQSNSKINRNKKLQESKRAESNILGSQEKKLSKSNKFEYEKDCLDLDDLIQCEFPSEFLEDKHEGLLAEFGMELMESRIKESNLSKEQREYREQRKSVAMKNDDYLLLICLLKMKKAQLVEKNPYHVDYNVKLEHVYINEKDENLGIEDKVNTKYVDVENFVKTFIEDDN